MRDGPWSTDHGKQIFKLATMAAILDIGMEPNLAILTPMPPSKVELNWTYHSGADMV